MNKLKKIKSKIKLGLPLTKEEKSYYIIFGKELNLGVLNATTKI